MKIVYLIIFFVPISLFGQFEKSENKYLKEKCIRYWERDAGIIIQKVIKSENDSVSVRYELGLSVSRRGRNPSDFMDGGGRIVFEDKSVLFFNDLASITYLMAGEFQYNIKHTLTIEELKTLQSKKIDRFFVAENESVLNKFSKAEYLNKIVEIENQ